MKIFDYFLELMYQTDYYIYIAKEGGK